MFHTIITLAYSIPSVYLFIRFWQFYIDKKHRLSFVIGYAALLSVYPFSGLFNESAPGVTGTILISVSNYLLPFFLYLFLSVLLIDILLLLNIVLKAVPSGKVKERSFRNRLFIFIITLPFVNSFYFIISPLTITLLLVFVSGIPMLEKKYKGNPAFEDYKMRTSVLIPLPPKK